MVGVAEDDLRADVFLQFASMHGLHSACSSHRHEDGRTDDAVRSDDFARSCGGVFVCGLEGKLHFRMQQYQVLQEFPHEIARKGAKLAKEDANFLLLCVSASLRASLIMLFKT